MVARRDLNAPPGKQLADIVSGLRAEQAQSKTGAAGVTDYGVNGDARWARLDGTSRSVRDVDAELEGAQTRIGDAEQSLADSQVRLDDAEQTIASTAEDLTRVETVVIPAAEARLQAADEAAQQELATLDGKLATAQQDLVVVGENIGQLETDLAIESDAREQLAQDVQGTFTELDTRLGAFATDEALAPIRQALTDAQNAVESAQQIASAANTAANAASQAALEAAGIAASKGRVIIQETEPVGEDRNAANIWIKPIPDDPATEIEEKAITYVYLEASNEWVPTSSDELAQAAQNALDAREAAQQAQQRAETAISNAATAQSAAEAAQRTADEATLDAREAHNEAVAAQERVAELRKAGQNLITQGDFETGTVQEIFSGSSLPDSSGHWLRWEVIEDPEGAHEGRRFMRFTGDGATGGHVSFPRVPVRPGRTYRMTVVARRFGPTTTSHAGFPTNWYNAQNVLTNNNYTTGVYNKPLFADQMTEEWKTFTSDVVPATGMAEANVRWVSNTSVPEGTIIDLDSIRFEDVTELLAAEAAAAAAQARADEAYAEAESKATPAEVQAAASAAEQAATIAAAADAKAKADQAKADALAGAATDAKSKADAAEAAAIAAASADAATKANKALQDALAALATARGEITAEIKASANGKNSITISTSPPSGRGAADGDVWWQRDADSNIFGQWVWGAGAQDWIARQVRSEVIANLDVHKLTGTSGEFETFFAENFTANEAVVEQLWADQLAAKVVTAQQVTVAPGNSFPDPGGLNVGTRNSVGGSIWSWNEGGKYWRADANAGGTSQFHAYLNTTTGYDSGSLTPGETYRIAYDIWHNGSNASQRVRSAIYYRRTDNSTSFTADGDTAGFTTPGEWHHVERNWTAPNDAVSGGFAFQLIYTPSDATEVRIRNPFIGVKAGAVSIKNGAVSADHVNAESVAGAVGEFVEAEIGNLKATKGTIGEAVIDKLWADGIAAKSITASRLTISPGNLIPNGSLDGGDTYWDAAGEVVSIAGVDGYTNALTHNGGTIRPYSGPPIPVKAGERYVFECWIRADKPNSRIYLELRNQDNTLIGTNTKIVSGGAGNSASYMMSSHLVPTAWTKYRVEFTAVAGTKEASFSGFYFNHTNGSEQSARVWLTGFALRPQVGAVLIEDGAITTPKLTVTGDMSAAIVGAMSVNTKRLVVTEETILNHATLIGQTVVDDINVQGKLIGTDGVFTGTVDFENVNVTGDILSQEVITAGLTAGDPGEERLELDGQGLTMYGLDPDGIEFEMARLGPAGENLLSIGATTVSPEAVSSPQGQFESLTVAGQQVEELLSGGPRGLVARARSTSVGQWDGSGNEVWRLQVNFYTYPDRMYRIIVPSHYVQTRSAIPNTITEFVRWKDITDGVGVTSSSPQLSSLVHSIPRSGNYTVPGMVGVLDGSQVSSSPDGTRTQVVMSSRSPAGQDNRYVAGATYPLALIVEDIGPSLPWTGRSWVHVGTPSQGSSGGDAPESDRQERYTRTWTPSGYGGDTSAGDVVQGQYGSYGNRSGSWSMPGDMRTALQGSTIEKLEIYLYATHWYWGSGGTASIRATDGSAFKAFVGSAFTSTNWPRNAGRWVTVPSSWHSYFQSGAWKGIGVQTGSTNLLYYGRFKGNATRFRATYRK